MSFTNASYSTDERSQTSTSGKPTYPPPMSENVKRTKLSFSMADRAIKRVIAPYVRVARKGQIVTKIEKEVSKKFHFYLEKKPSVLMRNLNEYLSDTVDLSAVLHESAEVLKSVTKSKGITLYLVDKAAGEFYQSPQNVISDRHKVNWRIEPGKTIAAYVAYKREYVMVNDIFGDDRFPDAVGYKDETIKSVLCVPVVTPDDDCFAIFELYRDVTQPVFDKEDLKIVIVVTGWMGAAIHQNKLRLTLQKQQELNDYLLDLTKCYFAETVDTEKMISEVVSFAKTTLNAQRGSFYIIDRDNIEFIADAFEEGISDSGESTLIKQNVQIDFSQNGGIPGHVARTCEAVNIVDALTDTRFSNTTFVDKFYNITRSVLCLPIMGDNGILGVVQVVNKQDGISFSNADQELLQTFCLYCALALHYSKLSKLMSKANTMNKCYLDLAQYHMRPNPLDIEKFKNQQLTEEPPENFELFSWYICPELYHLMPYYTMKMISKTVGECEIEVDQMREFLLSVKKSYRNNPYHNFEHAFSVCHCMFNLLLRNLDIFTPLEVKSMMVAAICHDLDHRGFTNNFLALTNDTLSQLYDESFLENHHFDVTMIILGDCRIFNSLSPGEFRELAKEMKTLILATDLALYFKSRAKLIQIMHDNMFDWNNVRHRTLLKSLMMNACDLSGQCKEFHVAKRLVENVYKEFYHQGDIEKIMGLAPLSMMDREKQSMIPEDQVQFITVVVIPCIDLVCHALPNTLEMLKECQKLKESWKHIISLRGTKSWCQEDSIVHIDDD